MCFDKMKLCILFKKVNADFLANAKAGTSIELSKLVSTMTHKQVLKMFRNKVNIKFPLAINNRNRSRRNTNEINSRSSRSFRGRRDNRSTRWGHVGHRRPKRNTDDRLFIALANSK